MTNVFQKYIDNIAESVSGSVDFHGLPDWITKKLEYWQFDSHGWGMLVDLIAYVQSADIGETDNDDWLYGYNPNECYPDYDWLKSSANREAFVNTALTDLEYNSVGAAVIAGKHLEAQEMLMIFYDLWVVCKSPLKFAKWKKENE